MRNHRMLTIRGQTRTLSEWARYAGVSKSCLVGRLAKGLDGEELIRPPDRPDLYEYDGVSKSLTQWAYDSGLPLSTVLSRVKRGDEDPFRDSRCPGFSRQGYLKHSQGYIRERNELTWEEDDVCQRLVADNPRGMEVEAIAQVFGVRRQRIDQVIRNAIQKLRRSGVARSQLADLLGEAELARHLEDQ